MADPPITQTVREGNPIEALNEALHEADQDLDIAQLQAMMKDVLRWAGQVTELVNRELMVVTAANREMINSRHGAVQIMNNVGVTPLTDAERTVDENIEFLICILCDDVYLPKVANHPGPIYIWCDQVTTFHANLPDQIDQINTMSTNGIGGVVIFNDNSKGAEDGESGWAGTHQWFAVKGES